jgi:tetratricopeptide (TPR) repeat protein
MGRKHRPREASILVRGALDVALEHGLHQAALRAYNNLIAGLWAEDKPREIAPMNERGIELARRVGDARWEMSFVGGSVGALVYLGSWDEALARAEDVTQRGATQFTRGLTLGICQIHWHRGQPETARAILDENSDVGSSENADFSAGYTSLAAGQLAVEGRLDEALEAAQRAAAFHADGPPNWIVFWLLDLANWTTDEQAIRELLALIDTAAPTEVTLGVRSQAARLRARLPEFDAEAELLEAERSLRELGAVFHVAVVQLERAERLPPGEAEPLLAEARATFERLRATPWLERVATAEAASRASRPTAA